MKKGAVDRKKDKRGSIHSFARGREPTRLSRAGRDCVGDPQGHTPAVDLGEAHGADGRQTQVSKTARPFDGLRAGSGAPPFLTVSDEKHDSVYSLTWIAPGHPPSSSAGSCGLTLGFVGGFVC
jgi:hypothetical protein